MGYKTKSMLKAIGSDYKPEPIKSGTQAQAGAYSRGNKDWNAVKSAINIPDIFAESMTAMGMKIGEAKLLKQKEAKELAERQRIEAANKKAQNDASNTTDGITISEKGAPKLNVDKYANSKTKLERLNPNITKSITTPGSSLNPVTQSFNNAGVDFTENFEASNKKFDPESGLIINSKFMGGPKMSAPDAFEKAMKRKARYTK